MLTRLYFTCYLCSVDRESQTLIPTGKASEYLNWTTVGEPKRIRYGVAIACIKAQQEQGEADPDSIVSRGEIVGLGNRAYRTS